MERRTIKKFLKGKKVKETLSYHVHTTSDNNRSHLTYIVYCVVAFQCLEFIKNI